MSGSVFHSNMKMSSRKSRSKVNLYKKQNLLRKLSYHGLQHITLLTLITVSVVTGEEYQKSSTEKYVERLKVSFEKEVESKFDELGFPETIKQNDYEFVSGFADAPRSDFDAMIRRLERQLRKNEKVEKKEIKKEYKEILEQLQLPSEMAEQLIKNPLTNDKGKSEEFINSYLEKLSSIQDSFYTIYYNHIEIIEDAIVEETIDIEKFLEKMDTYPEDFKKFSLEWKNKIIIQFQYRIWLHSIHNISPMN